MIELGQLEEHHQEFEQRNVKTVAISLEDQEDSRQTQSQFPHLLIVSDAERKLSNAIEVIHPKSAPDGGDTSAPTTILVDGNGQVRWLYRPDRFLRRLSPAEVLAAVDQYLK